MQRPNPVQQMEQITRLLDNSAPHPQADAKQRLKGFIEATEDYEVSVIKAAVTNFIKGRTVPRYNGNYALHAPMLAAECARVLAGHLDHQNRTAAAIRQLQFREEDRQPVTPESRARVMAMVADTKAKLEAADPISNRSANSLADTIAKRSHTLQPSKDPASTARRLGFPDVAAKIERRADLQQRQQQADEIPADDFHTDGAR